MDEKMDKKKEHRTERVEGESRIDYRIRRTKMALNLSNLTAMSPNKEATRSYFSLEFGASARGGQIIALYLYLVIKLMTLYLVKRLRWLIRWGKHD